MNYIQPSLSANPTWFVPKPLLFDTAMSMDIHEERSGVNTLNEVER